jgi:hypothetical protein
MDERTSGPCNCKRDVQVPTTASGDGLIGGQARRLFPPPRRRPSPVVVLARWWFEGLTLGAAASSVWLWVSSVGTAWALPTVAAALFGTVAAAIKFDQVGDRILGLVQRCIVPHRLRAGLIQAGVATRDGRLPVIIRARCRKNQVRITLWLPAGIILDDLVNASEVLAGSCGAAEVKVLAISMRRDLAMVVVLRPRWGWPG